MADQRHGDRFIRNWPSDTDAEQQRAKLVRDGERRLLPGQWPDVALQSANSSVEMLQMNGTAATSTAPVTTPPYPGATGTSWGYILGPGGTLETRRGSLLSHPDFCPTDGVHLRDAGQKALLRGSENSNASRCCDFLREYGCGLYFQPLSPKRSGPVPNRSKSSEN